MSVINAWVIYKDISHKKIHVQTLREELAAGVLNIDKLQKPVKKLSNNTHLLLKIVNENGHLIRIQLIRKISLYKKFSMKGGQQEARKKRQSSDHLLQHVYRLLQSPSEINCKKLCV